MTFEHHPDETPAMRRTPTLEESSSSTALRDRIRASIQAGRSAEVLTCLNARWDELLRTRGPEETRALYAELDPRTVLTDPEAAAVFWLLSSLPPEADPLGPFATRILSVHCTEFEGLPWRARLTITTAAILIWVERRRIDRAEQLVSAAFAELERSDSTMLATIGPVYAEFLLAAARVRLVRGRLRESAQLYRETAAFGSPDDRSGVVQRALIGQAMALSLNAEFDAAQKLITSVEETAARTPLACSTHWIELIWCQSMIWAYRGCDAELDAAQRDAADRAEGDSVWRSLAQLLRARVLLRDGCCLEAANVLRNMLRVTSGPRDLLLLQNSAVFLLGLALIKSNQPNAALGIVRGDSDAATHSADLAAIAAFAFIERGEPEAAIQVTDECVEFGRDHPGLSLLYVYGARAMAFEILGLSISAQNALSAGLGIAQDAGILLDRDLFRGPQLEFLWERISARSEAVVGGEPGTGVSGGAGLGRSGEPGQGGSGERRGMATAEPLGAAEIGLRVARLTPKEREVLRRLTRPGTLADVAGDLFVSENTVKTHAKSIYRKLEVTSRTEAADLATTWGLR